MVVYSLDSDKAFAYCDDMETLMIYELSAPNPSQVKDSHWKLVTTVITQSDDTNNNDDCYDSLQICEGEIISGPLLKKLAEQLCSSRLLVNREGICYIDTFGLADATYDYFRLNFLFDWSCYGVKPQIKTRWDRCCAVTGSFLVNFVDPEENLKAQDLVKLQELQKQLSSTEMELVEVKNNLQAKIEENKVLGNKLLSVESELKSIKSSAKKDSKQNQNPQPSVNVSISMDLNLSRVVEHRKRPILSIRFSISSSPLSFVPKFGDSADSLRALTPVDEDATGRYPTNIVVYSSDGQFDKNNWWFVRAFEKNQSYMLAVYGGTFDRAQSYGTSVNIPYHNGRAFNSNTQFLVAHINGVGYRFVFLY